MCGTCYMYHTRLVASLHLYVSFAEYRLFYRSLLQKKRMILRTTDNNAYTADFSEIFRDMCGTIDNNAHMLYSGTSLRTATSLR